MSEPSELERIEVRPLWPNPYMNDHAVSIMPRWWFTTDKRTMARLRFLPEYEYRGEAIVVGMYAAWEGGEMGLACDQVTGEYFRKGEYHGAPYGRVFAPAPPPVGTWSGEGPA